MITKGTKEIFAEMRSTSDGDAFGDVQAWRFALAAVYYVVEDQSIPGSGFRSSPGGVSLESYQEHTLVSLLARNRRTVTIGDLEYCFKILTRAREILAAMGKEY